MIVNVKAPVHDFARHLAPESRRALKRALLDLRRGKGDIRELEGSLAGYHRLRVGKYRLILRYADYAAIDVLLMEERAIVYEVFAAEMIKRLKS